MKILLMAALLVCNTILFAQATGTGLSSSSVQKRMEVYSWAERPEENAEPDIQKLFLEQLWMPGIVKFKSSRLPMQVPLIFDVYNNIPYYLQGNIIMEFVDTVAEFSLKLPFKKDSLTFKYRNHYPAIQSNSVETFYEVLVEGKIELLKCKAKSILLFKNPDIPEERRKEIQQLYFACIPGKKIVLLLLDADEIKKALPEYAESIGEILKKEKIKLKKESKLIELFVHLNNAVK